MTDFERILGYKPQDLHDFVMARLLYDLQAHCEEGDEDPDDTAKSIIKSWTNEELLLAITFALIDIKASENV